MHGIESTTEAAPGGPLVGVRVLDLGTMFAGPFAATLLGEFGADVIKIELPKVGDPVRAIGPIMKGVSGPWSTLNRNKRCISLDMRKDRGKDLLKKLVARSDLVIENFRPGTLEKWGLGYDVLKQANPRLIMIRISGFGQTGPYAEKTGFGTPATAFSGLTYLQGYPDRPPISPPWAMADYLTGLFAAMAGVMALYHLKTRGEEEGQQVDIALYESVFRILETIVSQYDMTGTVRERIGHTMLESAPSGAFVCQDGKWVVVVAATDRTFARLAEVAGHPEWMSDPRFDTNPHRVANRDEILGLVQDWFHQHPSAEMMTLLDENGVPACPVNSMADIFQDPQFKARENLIRVEHPVLGSVTMPGVIPRLSATPGKVRFPGPASIGEHNREVFEGLLDLSPEEVEVLRSTDVI
jgi:formyl-CoA transferase